MSEPTPATTPTQTQHPWRATVRTLVAGLVALLTLAPVIAATGHFEAAPGVAQLLAVSAAVTRVLAIPGVDDWLRRYLPWLAAQPKEK